MTPAQRRDLLAIGSLALAVVGIFLQFGTAVALIAAGIAGCVAAVVWAIAAAKTETKAD